MSSGPFKIFIRRNTWTNSVVSFTICRDHDLVDGQVSNGRAVAIFPVGVWDEETQLGRAEVLTAALNSQANATPPLKIGA